MKRSRLFDDEGVGHIEDALGREDLHAFAVAPLTGIAYAVATAVPRFDAHEGAVGMGYGGRPEGDERRIEFQTEVRLAVGSEQGDLVQLLAVEDVGVAVEGVWRDGQQTIGIEGQRMRLSVGAAFFHGDEVGEGLRGFSVLRASQGEIAAQFGIGLEVRQVEGRVGTDLEGHVHRSAVFHAPFHVQAVAFEQVANHQAEGEGELAERVGRAFEPIDDAVVALVGNLEVGVAGKAVLAHFVHVAGMAELVVPDAAYGGEEHRRAAAPEAGIALPEVFLTVLADTLQFGSVGRYVYRENRVTDCFHNACNASNEYRFFLFLQR